MIDYNSIFYRNELGGISSDDQLGKEMIKRLKLYRTIQNYAWVLELIDNVIKKLDCQIEKAEGDEKEKMTEVRNKFAYKYYRMRQSFIAAYRET